MMARDHRAEYLRRNELAAARGHGTRAKERTQIRRGDIGYLRPNAAKHLSLGQLDRLIPFAQTIQSRNEDWSDKGAKTYIATYDTSHRVDGVTEAQYNRAYREAFVDGPGRYSDNRAHGSKALRHFLVDITGEYTDEEYDLRYSDE